MHPIISGKENLIQTQICCTCTISSDVCETQEKKEQGKILTEINLAPIHTRLGEGNGMSKRPTPYIATAKKCRTRLKGRGFRPESRDIGPLEKTPPRLK